MLRDVAGCPGRVIPVVVVVGVLEAFSVVIAPAWFEPHLSMWGFSGEGTMIHYSCLHVRCMAPEHVGDAPAWCVTDLGPAGKISSLLFGREKQVLLILPYTPNPWYKLLLSQLGFF